MTSTVPENRNTNRVHTGYEWNKYNQTHYDHDNPPPKIVQGYKFNMAMVRHACLITIRFLAGPLYEDIAFKIVNKEWEYSHKKGFKCSQVVCRR